MKEGDILQTVSGSGKVVTDAQVDLKPTSLRSGDGYLCISRADCRKKGQVIATLDAEKWPLLHL